MSTTRHPPEILTSRLRLRTWSDVDRANFALMMADPEVMHDYGGPLTRRASDAKMDDYSAGFARDGYSRWLVETSDEHCQFVGYVGVVAHHDPSHTLGRHDDVGWRLCREAWGKGYATEAAVAALDDVFSRVGLGEVVSYTSADNRRSQAVMDRLGLKRASSRDFTTNYPEVGEWTGMVWVAEPQGR